MSGVDPGKRGSPTPLPLALRRADRRASMMLLDCGRFIWYVAGRFYWDDALMAAGSLT
jgi:hypothetical protein